ncbi:hypothetical protein TSMEX_004972 [Taenia solium]|eukprot:TsM_000636200 transcript=TsM_000636200 gene=TsM_000636200
MPADRIKGKEGAYSAAAGLEFTHEPPRSKIDEEVECMGEMQVPEGAFQIASMGASAVPGVQRTDLVEGGADPSRERATRLMNVSLSKALAVPDTLTTWEANTVSVETDSRDLRVIDVAAFTTSICSRDVKNTFHPPLHPLRIELLNVTAKAVIHRGSFVCGSGVGGRRQVREVVTAGDALRRSVRGIAEGIEKRANVGGTYCTSIVIIPGMEKLSYR